MTNNKQQQQTTTFGLLELLSAANEQTANPSLSKHTCIGASQSYIVSHHTTILFIPMYWLSLSSLAILEVDIFVWSLRKTLVTGMTLVILLSVQSSTRGPEDCTAACIMHNNWIRTSNELYPTQCLKISSIVF